MEIAKLTFPVAGVTKNLGLFMADVVFARSWATQSIDIRQSAVPAFWAGSVMGSRLEAIS